MTLETLENPTGYRIINMDVLTDLFSVVCYPDCGANLKLLETKKQGISFHLSLVCKSEECEWTHFSCTSKKKANAGHFDVNRRIFYSMRRIGNGLQDLKRFLMLMDHPPPMLERNYRKIGVKFNEGSAPKMEMTGVERIFGRSIGKK